MSKPSLAGAASLLAAPFVVVAAALVSTTLSDDASTEVAAFVDHRGAMVAGALLQGVSIVLLLGGLAWLAASLARRAGALAVAGGALAILGALPIVYDDGVHAAVGALALGLGSAEATTAVSHVVASAGVKAVEPLSLLNDLGMILLGVAAAKAGAPRWTAVAVAVGAVAEGAGFASGTKALVVGGFAVLFLAFAAIVRTIAGRAPVRVRAAQPAA